LGEKLTERRTGVKLFPWNFEGFGGFVMNSLIDQAGAGQVVKKSKQLKISNSRGFA
jgi:hypothetical protein